MKKTSAILLLFVAALALDARAPSAIAIRDARVVTVSGPALENATVVLRDGLIQDVGASVTIPADAWIIEGKGLIVYPGLIDALSAAGLPETPAGARSGAAPAPPGQPSSPPARAQRPARGPEDRPSNTSWVRAADLINPADENIETLRNLGFTTAVTFPNRGIFAGQGAVVNLAGEEAKEMVVSSPAGMYLTVGSGGFASYPGSLMGVIAYIRQVYMDADYYRLAKAHYAANVNAARRPEYDRALEGLLETGRALLPAERLTDIDRMIRFGAELKTETVLYGGHEGYKAADLLKRSGTPLLVSLKWPERSKDDDPERRDPLRVMEMRNRAPSTPAILAKAGATYALYTGGVSAKDLPKAVKKAVDAGLSQADLVRALTLSPAQIYGVADRLGSIDKGKIANLVVTDGELFREKTKVKYVFVDGRKFEPLPESGEEVAK